MRSASSEGCRFDERGGALGVGEPEVGGSRDRTRSSFELVGCVSGWARGDVDICSPEATLYLQLPYIGNKMQREDFDDARSATGVQGGP
jgi:hypothetical protein